MNDHVGNGQPFSKRQLLMSDLMIKLSRIGAVCVLLLLVVHLRRWRKRAIICCFGIPRRSVGVGMAIIPKYQTHKLLLQVMNIQEPLSQRDTWLLNR